MAEKESFDQEAVNPALENETEDQNYQIIRDLIDDTRSNLGRMVNVLEQINSQKKIL